MSQVDVIAHFLTLPGEEAAVKAILEAFVAPTLGEEGCLRYDLFVDIQDPKRFTFIEEWESEALLDQHGRSAHIAAGRAQLQGKLAEPAWVQRLTRA